MEVRFPHFTQSGETLIPVDCYKSNMYLVILRATTKKMIQRDTLKNITNKIKSFKTFKSPRERQEKGNRKQNK